MPLFTGRGDRGETDLMGPRVRKDDLRVEAMGEVDELNAILGVVGAFLPPGEATEILLQVQNDLFTVGAELSLPPKGRRVKAFNPLAEERVGALEEALRRADEAAGPQNAFVLPGGSREAALLHYARAVARRAERRVVALSGREKVSPTIMRYLNRLSSLLHGLALQANVEAGKEERRPSYP